MTEPEIRSALAGGPGCYDCGLPYSAPAWADVVVPDDIWKLISPTGDENGVLCFNCMNARLAALKLRNVPFEIASGPFSFMCRDITGETTEAWKAAYNTPKEQPHADRA